MAGSALAAFQLILSAITGFFSILFLLRFFMQLRRVSFGNQLGGFVIQLTNWAVKPLRRIVPGVGGYDWASLIGAFLIVFLATSVMFIAGVSVQTVLLMALQRFLEWILYGFMALLVFLETVAKAHVLADGKNTGLM